MSHTYFEETRILTQGLELRGDLTLPAQTVGLVVFAHGSGSSRKSSRNRYVANMLQQAGLGTLLFDLLTVAEEELDRHTQELRFQIPLLAQRLMGTLDWLSSQPAYGHLPIGLFGASTGAAAALQAAAERAERVKAVVSRGGRPDLAGQQALQQVQAPTLLLVGGDDPQVIELNRQAAGWLPHRELEIVPGASHLFEEPGALEQVAEQAGQWFLEYLPEVQIAQTAATAATREALQGRLTC